MKHIDVILLGIAIGCGLFLDCLVWMSVPALGAFLLGGAALGMFIMRLPT